VAVWLWSNTHPYPYFTMSSIENRGIGIALLRSKNAVRAAASAAASAAALLPEPVDVILMQGLSKIVACKSGAQHSITPITVRNDHVANRTSVELKLQLCIHSRYVYSCAARRRRGAVVVVVAGARGSEITLVQQEEAEEELASALAHGPVRLVIEVEDSTSGKDTDGDGGGGGAVEVEVEGEEVVCPRRSAQIVRLPFNNEGGKLLEQRDQRRSAGVVVAADVDPVAHWLGVRGQGGDPRHMPRIRGRAALARQARAQERSGVALTISLAFAFPTRRCGELNSSNNSHFTNKPPRVASPAPRNQSANPVIGLS